MNQMYKKRNKKELKLEEIKRNNGKTIIMSNIETAIKKMRKTKINKPKVKRKKRIMKIKRK